MIEVTIVLLLLIISGAALAAALVMSIGIWIGYRLARKTQGYRDIDEFQEITE